MVCALPRPNRGRVLVVQTGDMGSLSNGVRLCKEGIVDSKTVFSQMVGGGIDWCIVIQLGA